MERNVLFQTLLKSFDFIPTEGQKTVLYHLAAFLLSTKPNTTYLLQGYAGTGKTTLVSTLVKTLPHIGMQYQLLAPTGRSAKILSKYTNQQASTIHRKLYHFQAFTDGSLHITRTKNKSKNTVFIVDECSMISDRNENSWDYRSLLGDLIEYVFSGENCRLLLIGDKVQLPPVGLDISPAIDIQILKNEFNLTVASFEMTETMRQSLESGILYNATEIRKRLQERNLSLPLFELNKFNDVQRVDSQDFEELLFKNFNERCTSEAVIICRSNKRANLFNQAIRSRVLQEEGELSTGDKLMVVKNNYFQSDENQKINFIANGDMIEVKKINSIKELYGFHFADVEIRLVDYPEQPELSVKIILETLYSDSPALTKEESEKLYHAVEEDYADIPNKRERYKAMKNNPYFNALQVKFGYALTCHKTQGGQWPAVFIDAPYIPNDKSLQISDLRWFYTALTRAEEKVYFVNFKDSYFLI